MTRNIKALGLAVVAVLALSAVAASGAQAASFMSSEAGATLNGTQTNTNIFEVSGGRQITCTSVTFSGTASGTESAEQEVSPSYSGCHSSILGGEEIPATVTLNGCTFLFHATTTITASEISAHVHIICPAGHSIEVHVYANSTKHNENKPLCTYSIPPADNLETVRISNGANNDLNINAMVGVPYTRVSGNSTNCGPASGTEEYRGTTTISSPTVTLSVT
jgi:hypothetical protein